MDPSIEFSLLHASIFVSATLVAMDVVKLAGRGQVFLRNIRLHSIRNRGCVNAYTYGLIRAAPLAKNAGNMEPSGDSRCSLWLIPNNATMAYGVQATNHSAITLNTTMATFNSCLFLSCLLDWMLLAEMTTNRMWE